VLTVFSYFYRQEDASSAFAQSPVFVLLGEILRFVAPLGRYIAPIGVKFGVEESTFEDDSSTPYSVPSVPGWGVGPKTENFMEFGNTDALSGVSLAQFKKKLNLQIFWADPSCFNC